MSAPAIQTHGAGKTTTIRMLLGMIHPTAGGASVLGTPVRRGGRGPWDRVGYLVESPAPYPSLTVAENLWAAARLRGVGDAAVERRGLAVALFHEPELVILDEPANGLDPAGVVEVRELLQSLAADHGVTVLMSSHILAEVDRLATRIGVIHQGRLIEEMGADELERRRAVRLVVEARDQDGACRSLRAAGYDPQPNGAGLVLNEKRAVEHPDDVAAALRVEALKTRRSIVPLITALAFSIAPLVGGLFMYILADPGRARGMGLIGQKAQIAGGASDWPAYFGFLAQAATMGGFVLFAFVIAWVFGREFSDGTVRYLLALPTSRAAIIAAKLVVSGAWCAALTALITLLGFAVGAALNLPGWSAHAAAHGSPGRYRRCTRRWPGRPAALGAVLPCPQSARGKGHG